MPWMQGYPYYMLLGSVISLYMGIGSYRYRKLPGRRYIWLLMTLVAVIFGATAAEILSPTFQLKLFWRNVQQLPLFLSAIYLYAAVQDYTGRNREALRRRVPLLCLPVALYVLLVFTDPLHHWMRSDVGLITVHGVTGIVLTPKPLNMALIALNQFFAFHAVYSLCLSLFRAPKGELGRNVLLLAGVLAPVLGIGLLPLLQIRVVGFTAFVYLPCVLLTYFTLFRHPRMAIQPLARHSILTHMKSGYVLTDRNDVIVELNEAGERMLADMMGRSSPEWRGKSIYPLLDKHWELRSGYIRREEGSFEMEPVPDGSVCYGVTLVPTESGERRDSGMLITFTDRSEEKRYERELLHQAAVDDLTGVYNRRHFIRMVQDCKRYANTGVGLIMFDIDDFKQINDTYGHMTGDQALTAFARILQHSYQHKGVVGRIGGEEFALLMLVDTIQDAIDEAERFRRVMEDQIISLDSGCELGLTVSVGVAFTESGDLQFEKLYHEADSAMYHSKTTGKNKVTAGYPGRKPHEGDTAAVMD